MDMANKADEIAALACAEVEEMLREHEGVDEPFSFQGYIDATERSLDKGSACTLDPAMPELWRAVIVELHRRQDEAWRAAPDRSEAEPPWWVYSPEDFAALLMDARKTRPPNSLWRRSLEQEVSRRAEAAAIGSE